MGEIIKFVKRIPYAYEDYSVYFPSWKRHDPGPQICTECGEPLCEKKCCVVAEDYFDINNRDLCHKCLREYCPYEHSK